MSTSGTRHLIELNLLEVQQLFNTMDPSPFRGRDLDHDAEEFIVSWSDEYPLHEPVALRIHLDRWPDDDPLALIREGVHNYFAYRAKLADLEFKRLMRQARFSLMIGVVFLAACLSAGAMLDQESGTLGGYAKEGLTIAGWVAMWRPMQMYLYDWWPVRRQGRNFARLATMPIEVVKASDAGVANVESPTPTKVDVGLNRRAGI